MLNVNNYQNNQRNPYFKGIKANESARGVVREIIKKGNWIEIGKKFDVEVEDYSNVWPIRLYIKRLKDTSNPRTLLGKVRKYLRNTGGEPVMVRIKRIEGQSDLDKLRKLSPAGIEELLIKTEKEEKAEAKLLFA